MKKNKLVLIGSVLVVTLGVLFTVSSIGMDSNGEYKKSELSFLDKNTVDDATAWMSARLRDPETGERMSAAKLKLIDKAIKSMPQGKALPLSWTEEGPDNIGGRTRAICVDNSPNSNRLWAGSVSGGLFVSLNGANSWTKVDTYPGSKFINSMTQLMNGTLIVGTGISPGADAMSNFNGDGCWYSTDFGTSWTQVPGSASFNKISEVVCAPNSNKVWIGTTSGVRTWEPGATSLTPVTTGSGGCTAIKISNDGSTIVAAIGANRVYVSLDGGASFTDASGPVSSNKVPSGANRCELAISHTKNGNNYYTMYAVRTGSNLQGMHVSQDGGNVWTQFIGAINPPSNVDIYRGQGGWNTVASVDPTSTETLFVGGIDVWKWTQATNNPPAGGIEPASLWSVNPSSPIYVHADNHEFQWNANNRLYVGNDGGIGVSEDIGTTWYPANRGYNVTQFYGMSYGRNGEIAGGTQDNGTLYNNKSLSTPQEFRQITGGDGFQCAISYYNGDIIFSTLYNGIIRRSINGGSTNSPFEPTYPASYGVTGLGGGNGFPFYNAVKLFEFFDTNSEDSVLFAADQDYAAGDVIPVESAATGNFIQYTTPTALYYDDEVTYTPSLTETRVSVTDLVGQVVLLGNYTYTNINGNNPPLVGDTLLVDFPAGTDTVFVGGVGSYEWYFAQHPISNKIIELGSDTVELAVAWDTAHVQDPYQSWFVTYVNQNGGELWGTRDALRLSSINPVWFPIVKGIGGTGADIIDIEFSKDLNHLFVSAGSRVTRVDGLGSLYSSDPDFQSKAGYWSQSLDSLPTATSKVTVATGAVDGIALNPANPDDLIIFPGAGTARRSNNATSASPTFTNLSSISGASSPFTYDGIIDRDDSDIIVIGTSHGVFVSDNGGATWTSSGEDQFGGTPVFQVNQSWRTFAEGNQIPGAIFIATHGRGIFRSNSLLGLNDEDGQPTAEAFKTKLKAFPNPTVASTSLSFELFQAGDVNVSVYSITGVKVKTISVKNLAKGTNTLDLNVGNLSNGTYIVKFNSGAQNQTTKFIKR